MKGQKGEFDLRKNLIGTVINDPEIKNLKEIVEKYIRIRDNIWEADGIPPWHCARNCLHLEYVKGDTVLIEAEIGQIHQIRDTVFKFLKNPNGSVLMSDSIISETKTGDSFYLTKGVVYISYDSVVTNQTAQVFREIAKGFQDYKNSLSKEIYKTNYNELSKEIKSYFDSIINWRLIVSNLIIIPPPPPPFPDSLKSPKEVELDENFNKKN